MKNICLILFKNCNVGHVKSFKWDNQPIVSIGREITSNFAIFEGKLFKLTTIQSDKKNKWKEMLALVFRTLMFVQRFIIAATPECMRKSCWAYIVCEWKKQNTIWLYIKRCKYTRNMVWIENMGRFDRSIRLQFICTFIELMNICLPSMKGFMWNGERVAELVESEQNVV